MIYVCIILFIILIAYLIIANIKETSISKLIHQKNNLQLNIKDLQLNIKDLQSNIKDLQSNKQIYCNNISNYRQKIKNLAKEIKNLQEEELKEQKTLNNFKQNKQKQINEIIFKYQQQSEEQIQKEANKVNKYKQNSKYALQQYSQNTEKAYNEIDQKFQLQIQQLEARRASVENELRSVQATLQAAAATSIRQREKAQKIQFYKIQITDQQKSDIQKIWPLRSQLYDSSLVSKVIWTAYIQKAATSMCNRVLVGVDCGIYRITDLLTSQCYIGQSVNVSQRWKDHIKAGLGINNTNNKLYGAMLRDGVWNFSFELIEACERNELDAKEKYWINMYNSNELGLNGNKGNG